MGTVNVRTQIHLLILFAVGFGLFFGGLTLGGAPLGLLGFVIFFLFFSR